MRILKTLLLAATIILTGAAVSSAQAIVTPQRNPEQQSGTRNSEQDYAALVEEVFAPITNQLNLTNGQKFRVVSIVTGAIFKSDPLMTQLDELDDQIEEVTLAYPVDENRIRQLSGQEAEVMGQIIAIKAHAKANMYQVLTPQQRAMVVDQWRGKVPAEGRLGSISN
jgi:Spy/CpxP family protein refolding chaperone